MTSPAIEVLWEANRRGIELVADGDRLRYRPQSLVDRELVERFKRHKLELIDLLRQDEYGVHGLLPPVAERRVPLGLPATLARSSVLPCRVCGGTNLRWEQVDRRWRATCAGCGRFFGYGG